MKQLFLWIALLGTASFSQGQVIPSAATFLGYELGERFTFHSRMIAYFEDVANASPNVELREYGKSVEGRPLVAAFISSPENLKNLEQLRRNNLIQTGLEKGAITGKQLPFVWLSYNIHGDEAAAMEAAIATLESLAQGSPTIASWLEELVIVIDPCENPDGRDRYANWVNQAVSNPPNPNMDAYEHHQLWPGGRFNHYLFDLNRDWAWQTQTESRFRTQFYHQWMPHVHVDFHEMGYQSSYFFAPAAHPYHENITQWQRDFQVHVGMNHVRYFDQEGWLYFTKEVYDLLYPSYGDTWPIFHGAIGFTYEQGGSGRASVAVEQNEGLILTLKDRLQHHHTASLSTIETAFNYRKKLIEEFNLYFKNASEQPNGLYKSFVIKNQNDPRKKKALLQLLDNQLIQYNFPKNSNITYTGFDYLKNDQSRFNLEADDIVISMYQPQSNFVKVLFEPKTFIEDSLTYDLTAWALPYIFELEAYAVRDQISLKTEQPNPEKATPHAAMEQPPYAIIVAWSDFEDAQFLSAVLKEGVRVRFSETPFEINGRAYGRGTIVISAADNKNQNKDFAQTVIEIANRLQYTNFSVVETGLVASGLDLGSSSMTYLTKPKIAILGGTGVSPTSFGELWHFLEAELQYPVTVLHSDYLEDIDLNRYNVLILTGYYQGNNSISNALMSFVRSGGKVIALGEAMQLFARERDTNLNRALSNANEDETEERPNFGQLKRYENREREQLSYDVAGSIYKVYLDNSHPLAFGFGDQVHLIKQNSNVYPLLQGNGWTVGMFKNDSYVSGFVGSNLKPRITNSMAFGVERFGRGNLVYFCDSPIFRGFWHSGKLMLCNAIFFVGQ